VNEGIFEWVKGLLLDVLLSIQTWHSSW
jgi:hypothetical protein